MRCKLNKNDLIALICKQLNNFFIDIDSNIIDANIDTALSRTQQCLGAIDNKYYYIEDELTFNPYHSGQYSIFLYYLSNTIYLSGVLSDISDKIYYLNKIMNSVDWYYQINLPDIFSVEHPIGSILGRAQYANRLFIYQGVTVGGNKGFYPTIGENVMLYSNSTILGKSIIGNNVVISSGCYVKDEYIPNCSLVFGQSPDLVIKQKDINYMRSMLPKWK